MKTLLEIKVCGINDQVSMNTAIKCKVDYIGLVFYENSPRNISINASKKLMRARNNLSKIVALTVDPDDEFLFDIKRNFCYINRNKFRKQMILFNIALSTNRNISVIITY